MCKKINRIPDWLFISLFAAMRAVYSAAIEAFVCWGVTNLILSWAASEFRISYLVWYGFWYIIGFIVACVQYWKIFKDC